MDTTTNPAETLTDDMIRWLQDEAMRHGDDLLMAVCDVALAGWAETAEIDERQRGALEALGVVPEHVGSDDIARAICASVIRDVSVYAD